MKRVLVITVNVLFWLLAASILLSVGIQQISGRAWGWNMLSGSSMLPTIQQGDFLFVIPYISGLSSPPQVGDVIAFEDSTGKHVMHRIQAVSEGTERAFITKGDNNDYSDQEAGQPPVVIGKIYGTPFTLNHWIFRVPVIGTLALKIVTPGNRGPLLVVILVLIVMLIAWEYLHNKKALPRGRQYLKKMSHLRSFSSWQPLLGKYIGITLLGVFLVFSALLKISTTQNYIYYVSDQGTTTTSLAGGVNLGGIATDSEKSVSWEVKNSFPVTVKAILVTQASSVRFPQNPVSLPARQTSKIETTVVANSKTGVHTAAVTMLVLPPIIPGAILSWMTKQNQYLILLVVALPLVMLFTIPAAIIEWHFTKETRYQMLRRLRRRQFVA